MKTSSINTITVITLIIILTACSPAGQDKTVYNRSSGLTILGLDGATWEIIDPLIERGDLPGFKRLKEEGSWGILDTYTPTESVSIWTSIATGVSPTQHGVQTFTRRLPGSDSHVPSPGTDRLVPALWNIASDQKKTVVVAKWFATWPAEKINGAMLSPRLEAQDKEPRTHPLELFTEIDPFRYQSTMDQLPQPPAQNIRLNRILNEQAIEKPAANAPPMLTGQSQVKSKMFDDTSVWLAARYTYQKYSPDLFMVYLKSTDRVEHFLWGAHTVENPNASEQAEAEVIYGWYRYYDGIIQELLNDETRTLMVVSDHGMQAKDSVKEPYLISDLDHDILLEKLDLQEKTGPATHWESTQVYSWRSLPYDRKVIYRFNLKGREPNGIVDQMTATTLANQLVQQLNSISTPDGRLFFDQVNYSESQFEFICSISRDISITDSIILKEEPFHLADAVIRKGLPRGIHTEAPPGIIAIHGPGINGNYQLNSAHVFDVTPTALYLMNLPVADDFDGRALEEVLQEKIRKNRRRKRITSYGKRYSESKLESSSTDEQMLDELRALGYIN